MNQCLYSLVGIAIMTYSCSAIHITKFQIIPESKYDDELSHENPKNSLRLRRLQDVNGFTYSYYIDELSGLCITAKDAKLEEGSNIWFQECEKSNPLQLWRMSGDVRDDYFLGQLHIKANDDKCIQAQPKHRYGSRLRMYDCDERKKGQIFEYQDVFLHKASGLIVSTRREIRGPRIGNYLVLANDAWSTDEYDEENDDFL